MTQNFFLVLVFGLCIGSFLNVIIYRLPRRKPYVFTRSQCTSCGKNLNVLDLIPVFSWIFLKGKCRYCDSPVSIRYPFVELTTSILFLLSLESSGWIDDSLPVEFFVVSGWILFSYLIVLTFIDIDYTILPDSLTYSGSFVGFLLIFYYDNFINNSTDNLLLEHFYAYLTAFFGFILFSYIVKFIIKKPALGAGDSKLFAMSGIWFGFEGLEVTITLSFLFSALFVLFGLILKSIKRGQYIPFGPFICFSMFLVWFFGPHFWFNILGDIFWWKYI